MKTPDQVLSLIKKSIDEAIREYGEYHFFDKGPYEVLDYDSLLNEMKSLSEEDSIKIINDLDDYGDGTGELLGEILSEDLGYSLSTEDEVEGMVIQSTTLGDICDNIELGNEYDLDEIREKFLKMLGIK